MTNEIQESPYGKVSTGVSSQAFIKRRTASDPYASIEAFSARGRLFDTLEPQLVPRLNSPRLVSSIRGGISELLLTIPGFVFFADQIPEPGKTLVEQYAEAFKGIISTMPVTTSFVVLVNASAEERAHSWATELNVSDRFNIISAPDSVNFTVWAEDAYTICNDTVDTDTFFVEPASFRRADDAIIADIVASQTQLSQTQVSLYFQGGNILIGDDFWMIGADYPINSLDLGFVVPEEGETERQAVERVYGEKLDQARKMLILGSRVPVPSQQEQPIIVDGEEWTEVLYLGNKNGTLQPLFHIDMFVSFMGRDQEGEFHLTVADPSMAAEILEIPLWPGAMQTVFDDISNQLQDLGFIVHRNPMPLAYDDDAENKTRYWYFATSNNVIVQDSPKTVWIPTYGHGDWSAFSVTDQANKEIWEQHGFTVNQLPNFHAFAANLGAAHCISKYLSRSGLLTS